ncbi:hypothetical protein BDA99DRAFT_566983, partial [Phascolomyces articulosus]
MTQVQCHCNLCKGDFVKSQSVVRRHKLEEAERKLKAQREALDQIQPSVFEQYGTNFQPIENTMQESSSGLQYQQPNEYVDTKYPETPSLPVEPSNQVELEAIDTTDDLYVQQEIPNNIEYVPTLTTNMDSLPQFEEFALVEDQEFVDANDLTYLDQEEEASND